MSKHNHNYSQYSVKKPVNPVNENKPKVEPVKPVTTDIPEVVMAHPIAITPIQETVETVALPETVEGVVVGCAKLNVRAEPSIAGEVVCVIDGMSEIEIDVSKSTRDWFYVYLATGAEGYCMRKFVEAHM